MREKIQVSLSFTRNRRLFQYSFLPLEKRTKLDGLEFIVEEFPVRGGVRLKAKIVTDKPIKIRKLFLGTELDSSDAKSVFCNGYQSWTQSREFKLLEKLPGPARFTKPLQLQLFGDYFFYPYPARKGHLHSFTYTYLRRKKNKLSFLGSLSEHSGFTVFEYNILGLHLRISKDCRGLNVFDEYEVFDLFASEGKEDQIFDDYFALREHTNEIGRPVSGWTSWYTYFEKVTEKDLIENLEVSRKHKLELDYFQIDDGYMRAVGDWLHVNQDFPSGMEYLAKQIHQAGYRAGLWLAPFVCEKKSRIYQDHPEFVLRSRQGIPRVAGFNHKWSGFFYVLDIYHPGFREYLREVFDTVLHKWQYDMVKLDFLYAAALYPGENRTRGEVMHDAMDLLVSLTKGKKILGCGVPLEPCFGKIDFCRIGSDVSPYWKGPFSKLLAYRERISTYNSIISTIGRRQLNNRAFINDPDVFLLRSKKNKLCINKRYTLLVLNNTLGGVIFNSDPLARLSEKELVLLRAIFPVREKTELKVKQKKRYTKISFCIGSLQYLVLFNHHWRKQNIKLSPGLYYQGLSFQNQGQFLDGSREIQLAGYETRVYLLVKKGQIIAGSTGHIFPGSEIQHITLENDELYLTPARDIAASSEVFLQVPENITSINGRDIMRHQLPGGRLLAKLEFSP